MWWITASNLPVRKTRPDHDRGITNVGCWKGDEEREASPDHSWWTEAVFVHVCRFAAADKCCGDRSILSKGCGNGLFWCRFLFVGWHVTSPRNSQTGSWEFQGSARCLEDSDRLSLTWGRTLTYCWWLSHPLRAFFVLFVHIILDNIWWQHFLEICFVVFTRQINYHFLLINRFMQMYFYCLLLEWHFSSIPSCWDSVSHPCTRFNQPTCLVRWILSFMLASYTCTRCFHTETAEAVRQENLSVWVSFSLSFLLRWFLVPSLVQRQLLWKTASVPLCEQKEKERNA